MHRLTDKGDNNVRPQGCSTGSEHSCFIARETIFQAIKFLIVGASNTVVGLLVYYAFVLYDTELYLVGNVVGFIVSVANSYYWNNKYVFRGKKNHFLSLLKTYMMYGSTTVLSTVLLYILVNYYSVSEFVAPLITTVICLPLNYLLSKYWALKVSTNRDSEI